MSCDHTWPSFLHVKNSSIHVRLWPDIIDFGQTSVATWRRLQTTRAGVAIAPGTQPHLRFISRPDVRHVSHFQAAGAETWKWKATISFFFRHPKGRTRP